MRDELPLAEPPVLQVPVLRPADLLRSATIGLRARKLRAALSGFAVAVGIAAVIGVLGITKSSESALLAQIDQAGTHMLTGANGQSLSGLGTPRALPAP